MMAMRATATAAMIPLLMMDSFSTGTRLFSVMFGDDWRCSALIGGAGSHQSAMIDMMMVTVLMNLTALTAGLRGGVAFVPSPSRGLHMRVPFLGEPPLGVFDALAVLGEEPGHESVRDGGESVHRAMLDGLVSADDGAFDGMMRADDLLGDAFVEDRKSVV